MRSEYKAALDDFLDAHRRGARRFDGIICHPGGAKVLDALEESFELPGRA